MIHGYFTISDTDGVVLDIDNLLVAKLKNVNVRPFFDAKSAETIITLKIHLIRYVSGYGCTSGSLKIHSRHVSQE